MITSMGYDKKMWRIVKSNLDENTYSLKNPDGLIINNVSGDHAVVILFRDSNGGHYEGKTLKTVQGGEEIIHVNF